MAARRKARAPKGASKRAKRVSLDALRRVLSLDEIATRAGVSRKTAERWARDGVPKSRRAEVASIVVTDAERISGKAIELAQRAREGKRLKRPGDAPKWNSKSKQETRRYRGTVENVRLKKKGVLVSRKSEESIVHEVMTKAKRLQKKQKKGRFFVTFGLVEFGVTVGSGGKKLTTVTKGRLGGMSAYQTFASTDPDYGQGGKRGAVGLAALEAQVRAVVERLSDEPRHAAVLDSFTVKRYVQKSAKEVAAWRTKGKRK